MGKQVLVDVFVEDVAHEKLLLPLLGRIAHAEARPVKVRVRANRGGHARAVEEMRSVQDMIAAGTTDQPLPDVFLVGIDGNCTKPTAKQKEIQDRSRPEFTSRLVTACPDPHIERWYMADPDSFFEVVGSRPGLGQEKCQRDYYVHLLASTVREAGHPPTLGGLEWAEEIAKAMDLYRASKNDQALGNFLEQLKRGLRTAP